MSVKWMTACLGLAALCAALYGPVLAQSPGSGERAVGGVRMEEMTAKEFDAWIVAERNKAEASGRPPTLLEEAVLRRLRAERFTSDDAVMHALNVWIAQESKGNGGAAGAPRFPNARRLADTLLKELYSRPVLAARILQQKGYMARTEDDRLGAAREYGKAVQLLTRVDYDVDAQRIESMTEMADAYFLAEERKLAETLYLDVLSFPWYQVTDAEAQQFFRNLYIRAGRGLIDTRRGNLAALKQIFFVPAAQEELGPYLAMAIRQVQAGGPEASPPVKPAVKPGAGPKKVPVKPKKK